MRPVNLIPAEDRRGDRTELRTGALTYVLIGGLAVLLLAIIGVALTSKSISDKEAEKAELQTQKDEVSAEAQNLSAFTTFSQKLEARTTTVSSLAQSRFDWERVIEELARIVPSNVWLINLTGTVSPAVQLENAAEVAIRQSVPGPALEIVGCTVSEDAAAGFIAALEDIDGVTRVGLQELNQPDADQAASGGGAASTDSAQGTDDCRTQDFITQFQIVVAFDAVPAPAAATAAPPTTPAPAPSAGGEAQPASSSTGNLNQQVDSAQQATGVVPGG